jgi:hypothetical protein
MKGLWIGTYQHQSPRIPSELRNQITTFRIDITEYDGIHFSGTIEDDLETGGTRGIGTIKGKVRKGKISFVKQMPIATYVLPDGERKESQQAHRKIYYSGRLQDTFFIGRWKIKSGIGKLENKFLFFYSISGIWQMEKR